MLPELIDGLLPPGVHDTTIEEALSRFGEGGASRDVAGLALRDLARALRTSGAKYMLVGGSFPTRTSDIRDIDIVAVFERRSAIPTVAPHFSGVGVAIDVQYASEDEPEILNALAAFFQRGKDGRQRGILRIRFITAAALRPLEAPQPRLLDLVGAVYLNRYFERTTSRRGLLITIHGIMSHAPWNADLSRLASSQGWVVAPFIYGYRTPLLLFRKRSRQAVLDTFRAWLHSVSVEEDLPISVVAHSFGTYVAVAYLLGFDLPPHRFNAVILTGAILNKDLDWDGRLNGRVGRVLHEHAPSDAWVARMPYVVGVNGDPLMGDAGVRGFKTKAAFLEEGKAEVFSHTNVIQPDVISGRWLPFLNAYSRVLDS